MKLKFLKDYSLLYKLTLFFVLLFFTISCSSVKNKDNKKILTPTKIDTISNINATKYVNLKKNIRNFEFKGDLDITMNEDEYSGVFRGVSYKDSILFVDFYGPFGIDVGRVEITKYNLKIINKWHRKYLDIKLDSATLQKVDPFALANKILLASSLIDSLKFPDNNDFMNIDTSLNKIKIKYNINKLTKSVKYYFVSYDSLKVKLDYLNQIEFRNEQVPNSLNLTLLDKNIKMKLSSIEYLNYDTKKGISIFNTNKFKKVTDFNKLFN